MVKPYKNNNLKIDVTLEQRLHKYEHILHI